MNLLPAQVLALQLAGLDALGLATAGLRARIGTLPEGPDALVPVQAYEAMWEEATSQFRRPGLPTALAMAIPFGAFGVLDYLVGSADTVAGSCESAILHFAMLASDTRLECESLEGGLHAIRVRAAPGLEARVHEFTLACVASRLRHVTGGAFKPLRVGLPVPAATHDSVRADLYRAPVVHDFPVAEMLIDSAGWELPVTGADPFLHATLKQLARHLQLARSDDVPLVSAIRARLRAELGQGGADPSRIACLLGVSERTLQRRLSEGGCSFTDIVDGFRREESARLLCNPHLALVEVANKLGYSEQTSFTRAFKRWTGVTPGSWRRGRAAPAS